MKSEDVKWILENKYSLHPAYSFEDQSTYMIANLANVDSFLRESAFSILREWIRKSQFSNEKLCTMANQMVLNLQKGLGETNTDSVFIRSFSALVLAIIIDFDELCALSQVPNRNSFLSEKFVLDLLKNTLHYFHEEHDRRGFIEIKEWAHSICHGTELLCNFAYHHHIKKRELQMILDVLKYQITEGKVEVHASVEDYVFSETVYTVFMTKHFDIDEICLWLQSVGNAYLQAHWAEYLKTESSRIGFLNTRLFLQTFYFMVKFGISSENVNSKPFYKANMLEDQEIICSKIEAILHQFVEGSFYN